jgi:hypothetical protein
VAAGVASGLSVGDEAPALVLVGRGAWAAADEEAARNPRSRLRHETGGAMKFPKGAATPANMVDGPDVGQHRSIRAPAESAKAPRTTVDSPAPIVQKGALSSERPVRRSSLHLEEWPSGLWQRF